MALEPGAGRMSASPTNSGRASPISRKWGSQRGDDEPVNKDKAFRRYASGVERSLSLFDTNLQDWADYISFLGRLLKSFQAHPSTSAVIPIKGIVAKRLAQCLNPDLPSGVHQKALEVYHYMFSMIGREALSRDLPLYLPGLSSTLAFASLSVRAPFLALLETHFLKLDPAALRPALKALVLALLPGLEEETSEDFERTLKLVDGFKIAVRSSNREDDEGNEISGDEYFWQCFFLASITSNSRRLGALAYLTRNLPKLGTSARRTSTTSTSNGMSADDQDNSADQMATMVTSPEPGLLLRCFSAGLGDDQILIQRGFLDLLVTHLPLHARVFQRRVKHEDLELLMAAASRVVARRDMSLNRRLWAWLLGPEPSSANDGTESPASIIADPMSTMASSRTRYFEEFGLQHLTQAILKMIQRNHKSPAERARPFRVCLSLMDRWEIGGLVVPEIFLPVMDSVRSYENQSASKSDFKEVLRSASVFFDGVESGLIWGELVGLIAEAIGPNKSTSEQRMEKLSLVKFIIAHFNVREEEMLVVHAPLATLTTLVMIQDFETRAEIPETFGPENKSCELSRLATNIAADLIDLIPERAYLSRPSTSQSTAQTPKTMGAAISNGEILTQIRYFYVQDQGNLDATPPPFSVREVCELLVREAGGIISKSLDGTMSSADIATKSRLLVTLLCKAPKTASIGTGKLLSSIHTALSTWNRSSFSAFTSTISLLTTLYPRGYISLEDFSGLIDPLVRIAWSYLSASHPKYHVETTRGLWELQTSLSFSNHEIESSICKLITENDVSGTFSSRDADAGRKFSTLWTHMLQENPSHLDRRGSKAANGDSVLLPPNIGMYGVILGRPLFLLLDSLSDESTQLFATIRTWLQNLVGIDKLFYVFVAKFAEFNFLHSAFTEEEPEKLSTTTTYSEYDDLDRCIYYLQSISRILRWSSDAMWLALAENMISTDQSNKALYRITGHDGEMSLQEFFVHVSLCAVNGICDRKDTQLSARTSKLHRTALLFLHQILLGPYSSPIADLHLEHKLIDLLHVSLNGPDPFLQVSLLDVVFASLKLRSLAANIRPPTPLIHRRTNSQDVPPNSSLSISIHPPETISRFSSPPPATLVKCLQAGFSAPSSRPVLDSWIGFLSEVLPLYSDSIFQILIPLVETLCSQISQTFEGLQTTFKESGLLSDDAATPESTLIALLNGLEQILARAHERLLRDEARAPAVKSPDQPQGFFGNMVSGVFTSDTPQARSQTANDRLTVLLSFQDAVRICFMIWSWGGLGFESSHQDIQSAASFSYTSLRMRNRARRLLEHLFVAEALECLETVIEIWQKAPKATDDTKSTAVFNLLHVLDGSRPKHTIPAIFDAIYSRTNPSALDPSRKSTLTSELLDADIVVFLVDYARSLEDDAMDEIWTDCMSFLRDILTNPFPHRQTLPSLLEFAAILGEKVDNTTFGEQKRMRRELGDLFLRLLTATFTTKPMGFEGVAVPEKSSDMDDRGSSRQLTRAEDVVGILASIAPNLSKVLVESDRILTAASTISTGVIGPTIRSKSFPENVSKSTLALLYQITRLPNTQKSWKKDVGDAFNDPRFFSNPHALLESGWIPLLRQWALSDKERMPELLSRLTPPTTAGIVFGVGATSARLEADRKTQLNLRRIATLVLAAANDTFVTELKGLEEKIVELLSATTTSSPSSTTRAEIYMVLRALALKVSPIHLAIFWPIVNAELQSAISSVVAPDHSQSSETYNNFSVLQACKLLDTLLCTAPDDFQLHEWLFITDTIDAVYRPSQYHPVGLIDELSEELGSTAIASTTYMEHIISATSSDKTMRRPLLGKDGVNCDDVNLDRKDEMVGKVLRPFFSQLSIFAFERTYEMGATDWDACRRALMEDLFDEKGIVKAL